MADNIYDEIEIEDMTYDSPLQIYHYPCPCGDRFEISLSDLRDGETDIGVCPSCSLQIRVIYEVDNLPKPEAEEKAMDVKVEMEGSQQVVAAGEHMRLVRRGICSKLCDDNTCYTTEDPRRATRSTCKANIAKRFEEFYDT